MKNQDIDFKSIVPQLKSAGHTVGKFKGILFFLCLALLYGFILFRINTYMSEGPSDNEVSAAQSTTQPHIDELTILKLKALKDNSVNVQSLFGSRQNPFSEDPVAHK